MKSLKNLNNITNSKLQTLSHPVSYMYEYASLLDTPDVDTSTGIKIKKSVHPPNRIWKTF